MVLSLTLAIAEFLHRCHLDFLHEIKESRPRHAEVGPRSDFVCLYAVDVKRRVLRAGANGRREGNATGSWI